MKTRWLGLYAVMLVATGHSHAAMDQEEGLDLAEKSGCLACHAIDKQVVGPPWADVAARYNDGNKAELVKKVRTGGKGNWTDVTGGVPMPPYSPRVSDQNIEKLVEFVLSLDN